MNFQNPCSAIFPYLVDATPTSASSGNFIFYAQSYSDSLIIPANDSSIYFSSSDSLAVSPPDTLSQEQSDTLTRALQDSLPVEFTDTLSDDLSDTSVVIFPDTLFRVETDTLTESPGEIIESRDREIEAEAVSVSETAEAAPEVTESARLDEKEYRYDASYFLEHGTDKPLSGENIFIRSGKDTEDFSPNSRVFIDNNTDNLAESARAYETYLGKDTSEQVFDQVHYSTTWIPGMVIFSFLLLAWIKLIYVRFLTPVLVSAFNYREASKLFNGNNVPTQNAFLILNVVFAINGGLFIIFLTEHLDFGFPDIHSGLIFLISALSIVFIHKLKYFSLSVVGFLFDSSGLFAEYKHNISLYNKILGVLLLPVIVGLLYAGNSMYVPLIYAGIGLAVVFYLLQLMRGLEIIIRKQFSLFYLILYICAFEILPIIVLYKLFQIFLLN